MTEITRETLGEIALKRLLDLMEDLYISGVDIGGTISSTGWAINQAKYHNALHIPPDAIEKLKRLERTYSIVSSDLRIMLDFIQEGKDSTKKEE